MPLSSDFYVGLLFVGYDSCPLSEIPFNSMFADKECCYIKVNHQPADVHPDNANKTAAIALKSPHDMDLVFFKDDRSVTPIIDPATVRFTNEQ